MRYYSYFSHFINISFHFQISIWSEYIGILLHLLVVWGYFFNAMLKEKTPPPWGPLKQWYIWVYFDRFFFNSLVTNKWTVLNLQNELFVL